MILFPKKAIILYTKAKINAGFHLIEVTLMSNSGSPEILMDELIASKPITSTANQEAELYNLRNFSLKIIGLSKTFPVSKGRIQVLNDINIEVKKGEFLCIVGPSGCGKSTLLNIVAGLDHPDSGKVVGLNKHGRREKSVNNLLIFQEAALFPWLNVFDNISFGLRIAKVPKNAYLPDVQKYLDLVQLSGFQKAYCHQLSGGMKQRVALARALVMDPEVLLMDEPFAALDVQTRQEMYKLILDIWVKTKKTILFITHNIEEALLLSSRVLVMTSRPGRIKAELSLNHVEHPRCIENHHIKQIKNEIKEVLCFNEN